MSVESQSWQESILKKLKVMSENENKEEKIILLSTVNLLVKNCFYHGSRMIVCASSVVSRCRSNCPCANTDNRDQDHDTTDENGAVKLPHFF